MVKKSVKKKSVSKKVFPKRKSFFDEDNWQGVAVMIGVFLIAIIALSYVDTGVTGFTITGQQSHSLADLETGASGAAKDAGGFIAGMFAEWERGNIDINIAKYLLFWILFILIFGILTLGKFSKATWRVLLALPVSFLAVAYLTPAEVFLILTSYTSLGITLSVVLPFLIMIFGTSMLAQGKPTVMKIVLMVFSWALFTVIMAYKLIAFWAEGTRLASIAGLIMLGIFALSLFITIFNKNLRGWFVNIGKEVIESSAELERAESLATRTATGVNSLGNAYL